MTIIVDDKTDDYLIEEYNKLISDPAVRRAVIAVQLRMEIDRRRMEKIMQEKAVYNIYDQIRAPTRELK